MKTSVAIPGPVHDEAIRHLLRADRQEDLCFALWNPSRGTTRETALVFELVLPREGERRIHGNASFNPRYFERAISLALQHGCGLAFMHSHPGPGWQGMSTDDVAAEEGHAPATAGATGLPLVGLTVGTDEAWSARFWHRVARRKYKRDWCESVRIIGKKLTVTYHDSQMPKPRFGTELIRTVSAWGEHAQADLARLRVSVVGAGSVGNLVGESLARMGILNIDLFDFDIVEIVNLDRLLHATARDAARRRLKVSLLAEHLRASATARPFDARAFDLSIVEEDGFRRVPEDGCAPPRSSGYRCADATFRKRVNRE